MFCPPALILVVEKCFSFSHT